MVRQPAHFAQFVDLNDIIKPGDDEDDDDDDTEGDDDDMGDDTGDEEGGEERDEERDEDTEGGEEESDELDGLDGAGELGQADRELGREADAEARQGLARLLAGGPEGAGDGPVARLAAGAQQPPALAQQRALQGALQGGEPSRGVALTQGRRQTSSSSGGGGGGYLPSPPPRASKDLPPLPFEGEAEVDVLGVCGACLP